MSIEFRCPSCQTLIRTPDGSEGRSARCPRCSTTMSVPQQSATVIGPPETPATRPHPTENRNPFADLPSAPSSAGSLNPYAAPASAGFGFAHDGPEAAADRAWRRLVGPAIGMIACAGTGLAFMALVGLMFLINPNALPPAENEAEQLGAWSFLVGYFTGGLLSHALQILGAIAMLRLKGYGLAMAGAIAALFPCDVYCCLMTLPFGIWGLIVLMNQDVKQAFQ